MTERMFLEVDLEHNVSHILNVKDLGSVLCSIITEYEGEIKDLKEDLEESKKQNSILQKNIISLEEQLQSSLKDVCCLEEVNKALKESSKCSLPIPLENSDRVDFLH